MHFSTSSKKTCNLHSLFPSMPRRHLALELAVVALVFLASSSFAAPADGVGVEFDGENDTIIIPHHTDLNPGTDNWTMEFWVQRFEPFAADWNKWLAKRDGSGSDSVGFYVGTRFAVGDDQGGRHDMDFGTLVPVDIWTHVAVQIDRDTNWLRVFLNGLQRAEKKLSLSGSINSSSDLILGGDSVGDLQGQQAQLAEVRIWKGVVLTEDDIQSRMHETLEGNEPGLVAYWPLNEGTGTAVTDAGGAQDGTFSGSPAWTLAEPFENDERVLYHFIEHSDELTMGPVTLRSPQGSVNYQWLRDGEELEGETSDTLTLTNLTEADAGHYVLRASDDRTLTPVYSRGTHVLDATDPAPPEALYLTWQRDPTTTMTIDWHTDPQHIGVAQLRYKEVGTDDWQTVLASTHGYAFSQHWDTSDNRSIGSRRVHRVELTGLSPRTQYRFQVGEFEREYYFETIQDQISASDPLVFAAGGDNGTDSNFINLNHAAMSFNPQFIAIGGDMAYEDGRAGWANRMRSWFTIVRDTLIADDGRVTPMVVGIGNHEMKRPRGGNNYNNFPEFSNPSDFANYDGHIETWRVDNAAYFFSLFAFPGQPGYDVLDFGNYFSLIMPDSDHANPVSGEQTEWLEQVLEERKDVPHLIPKYHEPGPYGSNRQNDNIGVHWIPLFEQYGVRVVFENHDHTYKKTYPLWQNEINEEKGIIYVGDGSWGRLRTGVSGDHWYLEEFDTIRQGVITKLYPDRQEFTVFDVDGEIVSEFQQDLPIESLVSSGTEGGSFEPNAWSVTFENTGEESETWILEEASSLLSVPSSVTVPADDSVEVSLSLSAHAYTLTAGQYESLLEFKNQETAATRQFRLELTVTESMAGILEGDMQGPFDGTLPHRTLWNVDAEPHPWVISTTVDWLSTEPSGITVQPGTSEEIEIILTEFAEDLPFGAYQGSVLFSNTVNKAVFTNTVTLTALPIFSIPYKEDFEGVSDGTTIDALGWQRWPSSEPLQSTVIATNYTYEGAFPLPHRPREQVLQISDRGEKRVRFRMEEGSKPRLYFDTMVSFVPHEAPITTDDLPEEHTKKMLFVNEDSQLTLWHGGSDGVSGTFSPLAENMPSGSWHRVTVDMDMEAVTIDSSYVPFFRVWLDNELLESDTEGYASPSDNLADYNGGPWFRFYDASGNGIDLRRLRALRVSGPGTMMDNVVLTTINPFEVEGNFNSWREQHFSAEELEDETISGPLADPDGTGIPNLFRYAVGAGRNESMAEFLPRGSRSEDGLVFSIRRRSEQDPGVVYIVEWTDNLMTSQSWMEASEGEDVIMLAVTPHENGITENVSYRIPEETLEETPRYFRLRILQQ